MIKKGSADADPFLNPKENLRYEVLKTEAFRVYFILELQRERGSRNAIIY